MFRQTITLCVLVLTRFGVSARAASPATQPGAMPSAISCIYILPFTSIAGENRLDWAGKAVQQNLLTDLARTTLHPVAAEKPAAIADAIAAAKAAGAKYIIIGTYQSSDQQLRFNGQIIDSATGAVTGGISATGPERDLFALEDALSTEAIKQLVQMPGIAGAPVKPGKLAGAVPPALQPAVVVQVVQPPAVAAGSSYDGSALQSYVESNRTPSTDYNQQLQDSRDRSTYAPLNTLGGIYGGYYGGYGMGLFYTVGVPFGGYGYDSGTGGNFHHDHNDGRFEGGNRK